MDIPKIIFEPMSLEDNIKLVKWAYFENNESLDIHSYTIQCFPKLADINTNATKEEIDDFIEKVVSNNYEKCKDIILGEVDRYNKLWESYNDKYFIALTKYLNANFPENLKVIRATVGLTPVFPRYLETCSFSLSTGLDEEKIIETCAHEVCHFLWFVKWKELYPDCPVRHYDSPYIPWQYSEMVVDPILNSNEIKSVIKAEERAYDSFYEMNDENNLCVMNALKDIYNEDISIEDKIKKGYHYINSVLQNNKVK